MIWFFLSGALVLFAGAVTGAMLALVTIKVLHDTDLAVMDDSEWEEWEETE